MEEARKFCAGSLRALEYVGNGVARAKLRRSIADHDLVVMSYDSLRADIDLLAPIRWDSLT